MALGSPVIASELERDCRQDEFPTRYTGQQDEFPIACRLEGLPVLPINHLDQLPLPEPRAKPNTSLMCGLRKSVVWLGILTGVLFLLLVVEGGVLGSFIAKSRSSGHEKER